MHNVKRKTYMDTADYKVRLEENEGIIFVHVELKTFSKKVVSSLRKEFTKLKKKIKSAGYENIYSYSATPKFYQMFVGYEDVGPMVWDDTEYRVLKWELK